MEPHPHPNVCLAERTFPARWKVARVIFLYKGYPKPIQEPSSFWPISLLDSTGKLLERLVLNRIVHRVENQLSSKQFGFRKEKGTMEAIEEVLKRADFAARG